ncbi:M23 family metallopeptidase [Brevundimonas sp. SORGH_AS_0993]|uniref:M23 family metallopeptidase n=1 Tax=Brevundimonas sp. SORGH_AS_0993 TaxID=3041794 RepID=UPI00278A5936|nr:M23 family metallopeptidase [Brevundimonas sp. SORGH_AS_0993]MDQ1152955.1 murein DD-endopeptidase MepM/ murein hydrolase activator NlpD [Brevundimonas sp. SORGH_AS_0993]
MRRLLIDAPMARCKTLSIHLGQTLGLSALALFVAAFAPGVTTPAPRASLAAPVAPPLQARAEAAGPVMRQIVFTAPVKGYAVNSDFGLRKLAVEAKARAHKGVDIAAPMGTSVFTTAEGQVLRTGFDPDGYGAFIEVAHPNGMTTLYGHLSRVDVARGDAVTSGQRLGLVGSTGYSTGPHLHFEVRRNGAQINPARVMDRPFQIAVKPQG